MSDAYHNAGPSQCIVSGIGHEKEPMTAAASRLPWAALLEEGDFDFDKAVLGGGVSPRAAQICTHLASVSAIGASVEISSRRNPHLLCSWPSE